MAGDVFISDGARGSEGVEKMGPGTQSSLVYSTIFFPVRSPGEQSTALDCVGIDSV